jgi:cation diffusion facilitator family transporter
MEEHARTQSHANGHANDRTHPHSHGTVDPSILASQRGIWAVKWSLVGLGITAGIQVAVVLLSGSVALLADTIHNVGDALTAVPLWIAFALATKSPTKRFTYGYGKVEDLAGMAVVATILISAVVAGYEAIVRLIHPQPVHYLWAVAVAALVGFIGNESVAILRIRVGRQMGSAALIADGYHARVDGLTSLAVLLGALAVWAGFPRADPIVGLLITIAILKIVWDSAKAVFTRVLDGVDPELSDDIRHAVEHVPGVAEVTETRVRWIGHRLYAELNVAVSSDLSVERGHEVAVEVRHQLLHHLPFLSEATIHIDPVNASGQSHHGFDEHRHDDLPVHSH